MMIRVKPEKMAEYKRLHADVWPGVLEKIRACHIRNYSIFLRQPENILFAYWEYHGTDFEADMALMAADPETQRWKAVCQPCHEPLGSRKEGEWWAMMESIFYLD